MILKDQYPTTQIIDLLPKCYDKERETLMQIIHYKAIADLARICLVKADGKLYLIKFRGEQRTTDKNINKVLNAEYKILNNTQCRCYSDWINFCNATAGYYKVGDNILIDLDG